MAREFWRGGVKVAEAVYLSCQKTLGSTGEHDVWSGSGALPQPSNTAIKVASSSAQDAALTRDTWTVSEEEEGTDVAVSIIVDDVAHGCVTLPGDVGLERLSDAVNNGSRDTKGIVIAGLMDDGDYVVVTIGTTVYTIQIEEEATVDEIAQTVALGLAADPDYDAVAPGDSGIVVLICKTPAVAGPTVSIEFPGSGSGSVVPYVSAGPASSVVTAADVGGDCVLTAIQRGVVYEVTADTDRVSVVHTLTAAAGTGVRKVLVRYLDALGYDREEELTLLGTTAVPTSRAASALLEVQASAVGSGGGAAGTITVTDGAESPTTLGTIAAGDAETHRVAWKAGAAQRFVVVGLQGINSGVAGAMLRLRSNGPHGARLLASVYLAAYTGQVLLDLSDAPIHLRPGESVRATIEGNASSCYVGLLGYTEG